MKNSKRTCLLLCFNVIPFIVFRLTSLEKEKNSTEEDCKQSRKQVDKLQKEKDALEDRVSEAEFTASALQQENAKLAELTKREKEDIKVERERSAQVRRNTSLMCFFGRL